MEFREYTPQKLAAFIESDEFRTMPVIPISRHRALSHIANPRVEDEDMILVSVYEENRMVGYLGVLADTIYPNGKPEKGGWLSCMWVDPAMRGKGIAKKLLGTVLERWGDRILVTEFTHAAKGLYDRSGAFTDLKKNEGLRAYMRFSFEEILPRKRAFFGKIKGFLKFLDGFLNFFNAIRLSFWSFSPAIRWELIHEVDEELGQWIATRQENQFMRRGREELNWIIKNPWLLSGVGEDFSSGRYHFSAVEKRFEVLNFRLCDQKGNLKGFIMMTIRGNNAKVPYFYVDGDISAAIQLIMKIMKEKKLRILTVFHSQVVTYLQNHRHPFLHLRKAWRYYIISKVFGEVDASTVEIQDGDADCAFT